MADAEKPDEIEELMKMLGVSPGKEGETAGEKEPSVAKPAFEALSPSSEGPAGAGLDLISDVNVHVRVELGRSRMCVEDILKLGPGSVVPLESLTGDPLDIFVNDRLVARGEVLVVNDKFAIRVTDVITPQKSRDA